MKRFLQKHSKKVVMQAPIELCMEDTAKNNIRNAISSAAIGLGAIVSGASRDEGQTTPTPAATSQDKQTSNAPVPPPPPPTFDASKETRELLAQQEGRDRTWYYDTEGHKTIGIGQRTEMSDFPDVVSACFGKDKCDDIVARARDQSKGWSDEEIDQMFDYSYKNIYEPRTKKLVPGLHTFPPNVQAHLVSSVYRGSLSGSPITLSLLNAGDYAGAAAEYLRNDEYTAAKKSKSGVAGRMEAVSKAIASLNDHFNTKTKDNTVTATTPSVSTTASAPAKTTEESPDFSEHEVQKGDTLWAISRRTGISVEDIAKANNIDPDKLQIGQKLKIPKAKAKAD